MSIEFDEPTSEPNSDLDGNLNEHGRSTRVVALIAAAAVVAVSLGAAFALGRSTGDDRDAVSAAATPNTEPADEQPVVEQASSDTAPEPLDDHVPASTVLLDGSADAAASSPSSTSFVASGGFGWAMFGGEPATPLVERVTDDGYTLRVHLAQEWETEHMVDPLSSWTPAPWCFESGQMRVALSGNGVIDVGAVSWYREPYEGRAVSSTLLGVVDDAPRWVIVVQTPPDITSVTVTTPFGDTDTAAPANGTAVLTLPGMMPVAQTTADGYTYYEPSVPAYEVTLVGGSGGPVVIGSDGTGTWADDDFRSACEPPPPALPAAGEQPADPEAAEQTVVDSMAALYDEALPGDRDDFVDDVTGVAEARQQVAEGPYADQASSASAIVEELVFTTPTEAWFRYRIETDGGVYDNRFGVARDVDGVWKITRDTICQDLSFAGGDCGGGWAPVQPPGTREYGEVWSSAGE